MKAALRRVKAVAAIAWAAPCSAIGLAGGLVVLILGGRAQRIGRVIEFSAYQPSESRSGLFAHLPWSAITLGHVIIGSSQQELARLRAHELVHVRQFEQWGLLLVLAYPLASLAALLKGACPYRANWFEQPALRVEHAANNTNEHIPQPIDMLRHKH